MQKLHSNRHDGDEALVCGAFYCSRAPVPAHAVALAGYELPFSADLLSLRHRSAGDLRRAQRRLARFAAHFSVPSVGGVGIRSGPAARRPVERRRLRLAAWRSPGSGDRQVFAMLQTPSRSGQSTNKSQPETAIALAIECPGAEDPALNVSLRHGIFQVCKRIC